MEHDVVSSVFQAREIYMKEDEEGDIITGLQQKTNYGRPHWDNIFAELGRRHPGYMRQK